jgi:hypothetical protein
MRRRRLDDRPASGFRLPARAAVLAVSLATISGAAGAQPRKAAPPPHDSIVVSILTMGPGDEMFERFGHQSIRIHDLTTGLDSAYNWGMFSFEQAHFLVRFLTGDTRYWMEGFPSLPLIGEYHDMGRAVWEQELALTRAETDSLWHYIQWNSKEQNKWYRYDYYRDNCATRVRDALDMVLNGGIRRGAATREHGVSYRSETLRLARAYPMINFGMDFVLGRPADDTLSAWEEMFVPMRLQELIREMRVRHSDGTVGRLVRSERQLVADTRFQDADTAPDYFLPALTTGFAIAGVLLALCMLPAASIGARWSVGTIGTLWSLLAGVGGILLLCAGLFTRHSIYMGQNVNVLLATPASFALAFVIPFALRTGASPKLVKAVRSLAVLAAAAAVCAVLLRVVPSLAQDNRPLLALAVPVHAALALALWRATARRAGDVA